MTARDGEYARFLIMDEGDIIRLKHQITTYKPISQNDIAHLLKTLEKRGRSHLIPFFEKHILGKNVSLPSQASIPQPKKKKNKAKTFDKGEYQRATHKASDFQFKKREIRVGKYILTTERAFAIHPSILKKIEGEFTIRINPDNTFHFEDYGLTSLLNSVGEYCYSLLDEKLEDWFAGKIVAIETNVKRYIHLAFSDFEKNEKSGQYEIKDNAIKYSPLNRDCLLYEFFRYVDSMPNIPSLYRECYKLRNTLTNLINKFNKEFRISLTNILRKYVYYTEKDVEVIEWSAVRPTITVFFRLLDEVDTYDYINTPSFCYCQDVVFEFLNLPKGAPYEYSEDTIRCIEACLEQVKSHDMYDLLNLNLQSFKRKKRTSIIKEEYSRGVTSLHCLDGNTRYEIASANCLLDISDKHYLMAHPKVEDYSYKLESGHIKKIAYFTDPNYVLSQELPGFGVGCYLLANDNCIVLYALDSSKSTYTFYIKRGCVDIAMFLIWSYFSSYIYNKREGKYISIECLFPYFGIEGYDNTGSPISKNEERLYQFQLPLCFYDY